MRFVVHDLHQPLPFADAAFDRVVSGLVLEHLRDLRLRLRRGAARAEAGRARRGLGDAPGDVPARRTQARFTDPATGREGRSRAACLTRSGDFVMAAVRAGFALEDVGEQAPDDAFAARFPRAEKYVGWPMLVVLQLAAK